MALTTLYFSSHGRISRKVYWLASLPLLALSMFPDLLIRAAATREEAAVLSLIVLLVLAVPGLMVSIKRFHDRNKSGWFVLVNLIPLIGPLWVLLELGFLRGTKGSNRFGPDPLSATSAVDTHAVIAEAR
jgi:uncharacterized membrane protein YhaH (DUF805 family)